jgi:hypothetical protein
MVQRSPDKRSKDNAANKSRLQQFRETIKTNNGGAMKNAVALNPTPLHGIYRAGLGLLIALFLLCMFLLIAQGSFYREWINPFSSQGSSALNIINPQNLAVALVGTVGFPPFVIYTSLIVLLLSWLILVIGLQNSGWAVKLPFLLVLFLQYWLLSGSLSFGHLLLPLTAAGGHLILFLVCRFTGSSFIRNISYLLHGLILLLAGVCIILFKSSHMNLTLSLTASQVLTVLLLILYWYILGYDALDLSFNIGRWYNGFGQIFLSSKIFVFSVLGILIGTAAGFLIYGSFLLPFGVTLLLGGVLLFAVYIRNRSLSHDTAGLIFILAMVLIIVILQGIGIFLTGDDVVSLDFLVSPVVVYVIFSV